MNHYYFTKNLYVFKQNNCKILKIKDFSNKLKLKSNFELLHLFNYFNAFLLAPLTNSKTIVSIKYFSLIL